MWCYKIMFGYVVVQTDEQFVSQEDPQVHFKIF